MDLTLVWFVLIAVLWTGYLVLEGFDFGVGMLLPFLGRKDRDRRVMINTIGPVWDGNEVWLITAGGATFAAFPEWYATLFSGFYLPLLLILVGLILRIVSFEWRGKINTDTWRAWADTGEGFIERTGRLAVSAAVDLPSRSCRNRHCHLQKVVRLAFDRTRNVFIEVTVDKSRAPSAASLLADLRSTCPSVLSRAPSGRPLPALACRSRWCSHRAQRSPGPHR